MEAPLEDCECTLQSLKPFYALAQEGLIQGGSDEFQKNFGFEPPVSDLKKKNRHKGTPQHTPVQTPHNITLTGVIFSQLLKASFP